MKMPKQIFRDLRTVAIKAVPYVLFVVIAALFGYIAWRVGQIFSPPVNRASLEQRQGELDAERVKFDEETLAEVLRRLQTGPSTTPDSTGDPNPFD